DARVLELRASGGKWRVGQRHQAVPRIAQPAQPAGDIRVSGQRPQRAEDRATLLVGGVAAMCLRDRGEALTGKVGEVLVAGGRGECERGVDQQVEPFTVGGWRAGQLRERLVEGREVQQGLVDIEDEQHRESLRSRGTTSTVPQRYERCRTMTWR